MTAHNPVSTLQRPAERLIQKFEVGQVGNDTVHDYLKKGWSLAICCKGCSRVSEWTPPTLLERYVDRLDTCVAAVAQRLTCTSAGGCGSHEVAVFPHLYDGPWSYPTGG